MPDDDDIPEGAVVLRHIPGGSNFQQPPGGRLTSNNFQLRQGEDGLSVSIGSPNRAAQDAIRVLENSVASTDKSRMAGASAEQIRAAGFKIVRKPTPEDPEHAIIVPTTGKLDDHLSRKNFAKMFSYVDLPQEH